MQRALGPGSCDLRFKVLQVKVISSMGASMITGQYANILQSLLNPKPETNILQSLLEGMPRKRSSSFGKPHFGPQRQLVGGQDYGVADPGELLVASKPAPVRSTHVSGKSRRLL